MRKKIPWRSLCIIVLGLMSASVTAQAVVLDPLLDRHWVKEAQLIFMGEVVDVEYRSSAPTENSPRPIPHTFVTLVVADVFKGEFPEKQQVTLRFQGGLSEEEQILRVSGVPLFDEGDRGIFFAERNGEAVSPLVGGRQGWIRIQDEQVYSDLGYDLLLSDDPVLAARIHPRDIQSYPSFYKRMLAPNHEADLRVWNHLSSETRQLIEEPDSVDQLDPRRLRFLMPEKSSIRYEGQIPLRNLLKRMMPEDFRNVARDMTQLMLYRDLNYMLLERNLFRWDDLQEVDLRPETEELMEADPESLPIEQVLLRNRRVLEDVYPTLMVKSLDVNIIKGDYTPREDVLVNEIGEHRLERVIVPPEKEGEDESPNPGPEPLPKGEFMILENFIPHLQRMVEELHLPEELEALQPLSSVDPSETFTIEGPSGVEEPPRSFSMPEPEPQNAQEEEEFMLLEENEGNPVLR